MKKIVAFSMLPLLAIACGPASDTADPQPVSAEQAGDIQVPLFDPCKVSAADVVTWFPGGGSSEGAFETQHWPSDGATYAVGDALSCNLFVVDVGVPDPPDKVEMPWWYKGAYLSAYWTMPGFPELCSTLRVQVRLYAKDAPGAAFVLQSSKTLTGVWKTSGSGAPHCELDGGWVSAQAPRVEGDRIYRYAIRVKYGLPFATARPVTVVVDRL